MSTDVYQPCPCGSGKKLKFCCSAIYNEITTIQRLLSNDQLAQALQQLTRLKSKPNLKKESLIWALQTLTYTHLQNQDPRSALEVIWEILELDEHNHFAISLNASISLQLAGYRKMRKIVHHAIQTVQGSFPRETCGMIFECINELRDGNSYLAANRLGTIASSIAQNEEDLSRAYSYIMEISTETTVPYPVRCKHLLKKYDGLYAEDHTKALMIGVYGNFSEAVRMFQELLKKEPENDALLFNLAVHQAYCGDDLLAADNFRKAAALMEDYSDAVEAETLGQVLWLMHSEDRDEAKQFRFSLSSSDRFKELLSEEPRIIQTSEQKVYGGQTLRDYLILDREPPAEGHSDVPTLQNIPRMLGECSILEEQDEQGELILNGFLVADTNLYETALEILRDSTEDFLDKSENEERGSFFFNSSRSPT